ncbi:DnaA N-terminal domain-containing protein [Paenibacillus sp. Y412MC10]|uniref:DnaA N-terminal domain-containing protein n=1 Tax=Geobacillus sp. (strain Y412MC10) TaxID=481743 RepID=UPI0011A36B87|nr:DnaA N-terminal domain-containing protein [Paenibacillus sp. Y412MC10]
MKERSSESVTYFRYVATTEKVSRTRKRDDQKIEDLVTVNKKIYYTPSEVAAFSLESFGKSLIARSGNKTIIENYILDFWQPILGFQATMVYINYHRMCIKNDMPFRSIDNMAETMGISRQTLSKYLDTLESYGFVMRFWAESKKKSGMNDATRVKVRASIPLLSEDLVAQLPDSIRESHNEFILKLSESYDIELEESLPDVSPVTTIENQGFERKPSSTVIGSGIKEHIEKKSEELKSSRTVEETRLWEESCSFIKTKITLPSFQTWFGETYLLIREGKIIIVATHDMVRDWLNRNYIDLIQDTVTHYSGLERPIIIKSANQIIF